MLIAQNDIIQYVMHWHNLFTVSVPNGSNILMPFSDSRNIPLLNATPESHAFAESLLYVLQDMAEQGQTRRSFRGLGVTQDTEYKVRVDKLADLTDTWFSDWNDILTEAIVRVVSQTGNLSFFKGIHLSGNVLGRLEVVMSSSLWQQLNIAPVTFYPALTNIQVEVIRDYWKSMLDTNNPVDAMFLAELMALVHQVNRDTHVGVHSFPVNSAGQLHRFALDRQDLKRLDFTWSSIIGELTYKMRRSGVSAQDIDSLLNRLPRHFVMHFRQISEISDKHIQFKAVCERPPAVSMIENHCFRASPVDFRRVLPTDTQAINTQARASDSMLTGNGVLACFGAAIAVVGLFKACRKLQEQKRQVSEARKLKRMV